MLQIWNGKTYRYYSDAELPYASSLLTPVGTADPYAFPSYVPSHKADK